MDGFSQLAATQVAETLSPKSSIWRMLPKSAETLGSYLLSLSEIGLVRFSHPDYAAIATEEFLRILGISHAAIVVCVTAPYRPAGDAGRWPDSWLSFVREVSDWLGKGLAHCLTFSECKLFLGQSESWKLLWTFSRPCLIKHLLCDCSIIESIDHFRFFQVCGPLLPRHVLSTYVPREPVHKQDLTPLGLLYAHNFNKKFPLGRKNPLLTSVETCARTLLKNCDTSERVGDFIVAELGKLATNIKNYKFTAELERLVPSKDQLGLLLAATDTYVFREIPVIDKFAVEPETARRTIFFILSDLLDASLLGSERNKRQFLANVEIVLAMNRSDSLVEDVLWRGLRTEDFASRILGQRGPLREASEVLERLAVFLFNQVVLRLAKFCFYATEGDANKTGATVLFFRKNVWHGLVAKAERGYVAFLGLRPAAAVGEADSRVRWVPKKKGLRPIMRQTKTVKSKCRKLLAVLNCLTRSFPEKLGNSILTRDRALKKLVEQIGNIDLQASEQIYCFTADIRNCYESIDHARLFACLDTFPQSTTYAFSTFTLFSDSASVPMRWKMVAYPEGDIAGCLRQICGSCTLTVIIPAARQYTTWPASLSSQLAKVKTVVSNWTFKLLSGKFRIGNRGLVQGSSLASSLVALYYGSIDPQLPHRDQSVVLRLVDDILCITGSLSTANALVHAVADQQLFGTVNFHKATGNFGTFKSPVTWLGMELDPRGRCLNFSALPSPSTTACKISSLETTTKLLFESATRAQRLRLIPILVSPDFNHETVVLANAYKAGQNCGVRLALTALRFSRVASHAQPLSVRGVAKSVMKQRIFRKLHPGIRHKFYAGMKRTLKSAGFSLSKL